jgi:circadian clock protein KaiC
LVKAGERNRALTIVKSRGTAHSNQVRELVLSDEGVTLAEVYASGGDVLMGTLRWEREEEMRAARERRAADLRRKKQELALAEAEAQARIATIEREIESLRYEADQLNLEGHLSETRQSDMQAGIRSLRRGSKEPLESDTGKAGSEPPAASPGEEGS